MLDLTKPRPKSQLPDENLKDLYNLYFSAPKGNAAEVGVYRGGSALALYQVAQMNGQKLFLFDTFQGFKDIPDMGNWKDQFGDTSVAEVLGFMPQAKAFVGVFPDTLTDECTDLSFIHVDCDIYYSCEAAISKLWPRVKPGGIMAFDDFNFEDIKKSVTDNFSAIRFSPNKIPYVIKE